MKKKLSIFLVLVMMASMLLTACGNKQTEETQETTAQTETEETEEAYHIAVVTPTLSVSEDEFRAGEQLEEQYPDIVKHLVLPEKFDTEIEGCISTIVSAADDPLMKAVIVSSGQSGLIPAFQQLKEKNPDIITISSAIYDEPDMMSENIDLNLDMDAIRRGETIPKKAYEMGAKTFIHYSFPTHLAKPTITARRDQMKKTCEELGMEFVEVITPDPQTGNGPEAMQQFLQEDIPRQIEKYGVDTNIFGTNCPMYDVIIAKALELKYTVAEQCCPTPTQAYPTVLGLEIAEEDATNFDKINEMIAEKVDAQGMKGRLSGWPIPVTIFLPKFGVEVAMEMIANSEFDPNNAENLGNLAKDKFGLEVDFQQYEDYENYYMFIMESIYY
ncbi:MAG: DUF3798 domain-containing protein [Lachnospiraceae bacterium]|nr:DUF3798 domain-containing protein [Clostridiales bacterium]MDO5391660.1 DUF3798 domain-containing protein [Eubacteriales bacterium]